MSLVSCGLSDSEKESMNISITIHNNDAKLKFDLDSLQEVTNYKIKLLGVIPKNEWDSRINSYMMSFRNHWNDPYKIERDYNLTLESYLTYCKTMGYDPKTYIDIINK